MQKIKKSFFITILLITLIAISSGAIVYYALIPSFTTTPTCDISKHLLGNPSSVFITQQQFNNSFSISLPVFGICSFARLSTVIDFSNHTISLPFLSIITIAVNYTDIFGNSARQILLQTQTNGGLDASGIVLFATPANTPIVVYSIGIMPKNYNVKILLEQISHA